MTLCGWGVLDARKGEEDKRPAVLGCVRLWSFLNFFFFFRQKFRRTDDFQVRKKSEQRQLDDKTPISALNQLKPLWKFL